MCGYTCARSFLILLSLFFLLVGGGLLGIGIYGQVYEIAHDKHFLKQFIDGAQNPPLEDELISRILLYFQVVTGVSIGLGAVLFFTAIAGLVGACQHFKSKTRYGAKRSTLGCFVFLILIILFASGLIAAFMLYVGIDGKSETDPNGPTARPDYKLNWKVVDLQESAIRIYNDLVDFCWRTKFNSPQSEGDSAKFVTNTLFLSGGVLGAVVVLVLVWMIVGCCFSCGRPEVNEMVYISPEKQKYDDWIYNDRNRAAYS